MREPTELEKQQDARLAEIVALARQRYLEAGVILGVVQMVGMVMIT